MRNYFGNDGMYFTFPLDGDCLNEFDGTVDENGNLSFFARVQAPADSDIWINGVKAEPCGGSHVAELSLIKYETLLEAVDKKTGKTARIKVFRLKNSTGKYRISVDDNILFLKDINDHKDEYKSIFENPYLAIFKKAHDLYGACVHLNLFWEHNDESNKRFSIKRDYFNLSMMTDKFRDEFKANSTWLKFSFHAKSDFPDRPYLNTEYDRISEDIERVDKEIIRFAGEEALSRVTTLHWGASNLTGVKALRAHGYRGLAGYFETTPENETLVAYHYPLDFVRHVGERDFWRDTVEDVTFGRIDIVLNLFNKDTVLDGLKRVAENPHRLGFLSMMIHEQYFHSDFVLPIPEFEEIILKACKFAKETGHEGSFLSPIIFADEI